MSKLAIKELRVVLLTILLGCLLGSLPVIASTVVSATNYGTVTITNNSTLTVSPLAVNVSINTPAWISSGILNSSANNVADQFAGADSAFMPGNNSTNPWIFFQESIAAKSTTGHTFYTGNVSGGKIRYFPSSTGMTIADNDTMEPSANFSMEVNGYVDTSLVGSASANTTSTIASSSDDCNMYWNGTAWVFGLTALGEVGYWDATANKYGAGLRFIVNIPVNSIINSAYLTFTANTTLAANTANCTISGQDVDDTATFTTQADFQARRGTANVTTANVTWAPMTATTAGIQFNSPDISAVISEITSRVGWGSGNGLTLFVDDFAGASVGNAAQRNYGTYDTAPLKTATLHINYTLTGSTIIYKQDAIYVGGYSGNVTAAILGNSVSVTTVVANGEHDIIVTSDGTNFWMTVDGVPTTNVTTASVPVNSSNWSIGSAAILYLGNPIFKEYVGGVLKCYIENWSYNQYFPDTSGNGNTGTPSFRTTSSNADVTAVLTAFSPVIQAKAIVTPIGSGTMVDTAPAEPPGTYTETSRPGIFFEPLIYDIFVTIGHLPEETFWFPFWFFLVIFGGMVTFRMSGSLMLKAIVMGALLIFGAVPGMNIYGFWVIIYFGFFAFCLIVLSRNYGW